MKKTKLISILTTAFVVILALTTVVAATVNIGGVNINPDASNKNIEKITETGNDILKVIRVVGTIIAVGMVLVLGIKYMMGSAEEKAANKKSMLPYLIGAALLFFAVNIVEAIYNWAK